jgi:regulatory protein
MVLLRYRPRSIAEARRRLLERGFDRSVAEETIQHAVATDQLDDAAFAKLWVRDRLWHHPLSRAAVARELRDKGIDSELISATIEKEYPAVREMELAAELARQRMRRLCSLPGETRTRRLAAFLARRGFARGLVVQAVRVAETECNRDNL